MTKYCPISGDEAEEIPSNGDFEEINCPACGSFKISNSLLATLPNKQNLQEKEKALLRHYIRQKNEAGEQPFLYDNLVDQIIQERSLPRLPEQLDNVILYLGQKSSIGEHLSLSQSLLQAIAGALDGKNLSLILNYLLGQEYITNNGQAHFLYINDKTLVGLSVKGWERFYELEKGMVNHRLAFMAMPFGHDRLDQIYLKWFKPACKAVGFELRRVDEKPEAGIINNKMIVDIRKSSFVVAELTDENRGVYWEAGFAEGLNRPVIYTCEKKYTETNSLHFDIRQHHTVFWTDTEADLEAAAKKLALTIQATIPEANSIDVDTISWQ